MIRQSIRLRNRRLQATADDVEEQGGTPTLTLYPGSMPAQTTDPVGEDPLVVLPVPLPFAVKIENGVLTGPTFPETMATGSGDAAWARLADGAGTAVMDLAAGEPDLAGNPTAPVAMPATTIYQGMLVKGISVTFAEG